MAAVDDVYESWEDMDDIGLDRKFTNFLPAAAEQCPKKSQIISNGSVKVLIDMNGSIGAQLMAQQPAVKILKRPVGINGSNSNGECKARPVKTLQQRQQEYEQARLRILGEARSPEDVAEENITNLQIKMEASCIQPVNRIKEKNPVEILSPKVSLTNGHSTAVNSPSTHSSNPSSTNSSWTNASPLTTGSPSTSSPAHTSQLRVLSPPPVNLVSLLRTPRGPDGTRGFTLIR